jgi:hypothetical protein
MDLLLDCDGVLADFVGEWLRRLGMPWHVPTTYDLSCTGLPLPRIRDAKLWAEGRVGLLDPYPGVYTTLRTLRSRYDVYCVSALMHCQRRYWLEDVLDFPSDRIVLTKAKHKIPGAIFVDDHPPTVRAWQDAHPFGLGYVMNRSYNQGWHSELPRIWGLEEL